ncbi:MAG: hypothetical protein OZSIB_2955 [Candidatus Ozemobacter sibiricus]|jgi:hypothetical protein|uniref:Uncharacterized protein n=1 Tax=Candidatus Ozemobacter sibiricus TaxID=2268124 RepID=A0A367ZTF7_9BACT|nr:MAG: hypothetical protein OZSIB_2955 [Candidatus Ozemobacter sibiricus]
MGLCCLLQILASRLEACDPEPGVQHFPQLVVKPPILKVGYFEVHNERNGLPCNRIRSLLVQDEMVLAGTEGDGLLLYAGRGWRQFTPKSTPAFPSVTVVGLAPGEKAFTALAATIDGLVEIAGLDGHPRFTLIRVPPPFSSNLLAVARPVEAAPDASDRLVGTNAEVGLLSGAGFLPFSPPDDRQPTGFGVILPTKNTVWVGCSDGLYRTEGGKLSWFAPPGLDFGWVQALTGVENDLFVGGSNGGWRLRDDTPHDLLPGVWVTALGLTPGSPPQFDGSAFRAFEFRQAGTRQAIEESASYRAVKADLDALNLRYQRYLTTYAGQGNPPASEVNAMWSEFMRVQDRINQLGPSVQIEAALARGLWVGTQDQGVILFGTDGQRYHFTSENSKLPENRITAIGCRRDGETWIGTWENGLLRYTRIVVSPDKAPEKLWSGRPTLIRVLSDRLYVGTEDEGLIRLDPRTGQLEARFSSDTIPGFPRRITGLGLDDKSRLWVAGDTGVFMEADGRWKRFTVQEGLPDQAIRCLEVDAWGRVYVAGGAKGKISEQVAVFNGEGFSTFRADFVARLLGLAAADRAAALRQLGLIGTFQREFAAHQASAALALYDRTASASEVVAMLGTPHYLLIGGAGGEQAIFDGEGFKFLSAKATGGSLDRIVRLARRQNGDHLIMGRTRLFLFDGQHYREITSLSSLQATELTDLVLDPRNPDTFWVGYHTVQGGGFALFQDPIWKEVTTDEPVRSVAPLEPFIYYATNSGVWRVVE